MSILPSIARLFVAVFALVCSGLALGAFPPTTGWDSTGCNPTVYPVTEVMPTGGSAVWECRALTTETMRSCGYSFSAPEYGSNYYFAARCTQFQTANLCPENSAKVGSDCVCNAGFAEQGGQCVDINAQCAAKSGQDSIVNFTVGYARTPDSADLDIVGPVNQFPASGELCYQGCKVGASIGGPGVTAWRSQTPTAQGLYRLSMDLPAVQLGTACTADGGSSAPLRPDLPSPTCPGFVGEINGKPGCYGTAGSPVNVVPADRPPVAPVAGNPAAGQKPASGEGSGTGSAGRTPTTGNGGNAGGPASAAVGGAGGGAGGTAASGAGTKPTEDGKEQVACGAPGQPKCGIDEGGTPKDYTGKDGLTEWKAAVDSNRAQIKDSGGGVFDGFAVFFSAPPVAACSSFALPNDYGSLDPCPVVDGVRGVMGYIWALGALFLCIGWIREAI